jgi:hypothetical protein
MILKISPHFLRASSLRPHCANDAASYACDAPSLGIRDTHYAKAAELGRIL